MVRLKLVYMLAATYLMAITEGFSASETAAARAKQDQQGQTSHLNRLESSRSTILKIVRLAFVTNNAAWRSGKALVAILEYIEGHLFQVQCSQPGGTGQEKELQQLGPDYDDYQDYDAEEQPIAVVDRSKPSDEEVENMQLVAFTLHKLWTLTMLTIVFSMIFDFQNLL